MLRLTPTPRDEESESSAFWLITYSDMVTLLFAFFIIMYSFTLMTEDSQGLLVQALNVVVKGGEVEVVETTAVPLEQTAEEIAKLLSLAGEKAYVAAAEKEVSVVLPSGVTFRSGDATLLPAAVQQLTAVAKLLHGIPNTVRVEGHTDDVPIATAAFPSNWHLSAARAQSVLRLLLEAGIDPRRLQVLGYGEHRPRQPNETPEGRAQNRRIELKLMRTER